MEYKVVTPATTHPISLTEAKAHALVDTDRYDTEISNYIVSATREAENDTWRAFVNSVYDMVLNDFPNHTMQNPHASIYFPRSPLVGISSFTYIDTNGDSQSLVEGTDFEVDTFSEPGRVYPAYNTVWPACRGYVNDVTIRFTSGYGTDAGDVPEQIRQAIRLLTTHYIDRRAVVSFVQGVVMEPIPKNYDDALSHYRIRDKRIFEQ